MVKTPDELKAEYDALIADASEVIRKSEPFKTVTWKDGAPVVKPPSLWDRLTSKFR